MPPPPPHNATVDVIRRRRTAAPPAAADGAEQLRGVNHAQGPYRPILRAGKASCAERSIEQRRRWLRRLRKESEIIPWRPSSGDRPG